MRCDWLQYQRADRALVPAPARTTMSRPNEDRNQEATVYLVCLPISVHHKAPFD